MSLLDIIAWIGVVTNLAAYAWTCKRPDHGRAISALYWTNALSFGPIAATNVLVGAWQSVVINLGYGIPAVLAVLREISRRRKRKGPDLFYDYSAIPVISDPECPPGQAFLLRPEWLNPPPVPAALLLSESTLRELAGDAVWTPDGYIPRSMFSRQECGPTWCADQQTRDDGCGPGGCKRRVQPHADAIEEFRSRGD